MNIVYSLCILSFIILTHGQSSNLTTSCQPYFASCYAETTVIDNLKFPCYDHYSGIAPNCEDESDDDFWECMQNEFDFTAANMTTATSYLLTCLYEESKPVTSYSFYKNKKADRGVTGLDSSTFMFQTGDYHAEDLYACNLNINFGGLDVIILPYTVTGTIFIDPVVHINIHACLMSANQTSCSVKFYQDTDVTGGGFNAQTFVERGNEGDYTLQIELPYEGTWRVMGHIRYYTNDTTDSDTEPVYTRWDIGKTQVVEAQAPLPDQNSVTFYNMFTVVALALFLF